MPEEAAGPVVIVGGGHAGAAFVVKARSLGLSGPLTLIAAEQALPYQRPPLSKTYLKGEMSFEQMLLRPEDWYAGNDVELRLGETVTAVDRDAKSLVLQSGGSIAYDKLVLATGSTPRRMPDRIGGALDGVYTLRDLADADRISAEAKPGRKMLVVGGGYIGLEAAATGRMLGLEVTVVEMAERILQRVGSPETSRFFRSLHTGHGVDLREGTGVAELTHADGKVTGAQLSDGSSLEADFVVCGIGIVPNDGLASGAGLDTKDGILVDGNSRTSDSDIFAAGDCARFQWRGQSIRLESVQNANDQAENAAAAIAGAAQDYAPVPWFWSDQYDVKLQIAGLGNGYTETITRPGKREGTQSVWYYRDDEMISVEAMNDPAAYMLGRKLLAAGKSPPREAISDPDANLKQFM